MLERTFMIAKKKFKKAISQWRRARVRVIVLAGQGKAGKDVFLSYFRRNYSNFRHYRIAETPIKIAEILELPRERRVLQALFHVNDLLYPILGESAYKRRIARLIDKEKPHFALVEAVRTKEEYEEFVVKRGGILVGVRAPAQLRYERALRDAEKRGSEKRDEKHLSFREFLKRETLPIERDIDWIVGRAHFILTNDLDDYPAFYKKIDAVMRELGISKKRGKAGVRRN